MTADTERGGQRVGRHCSSGTPQPATTGRDEACRDDHDRAPSGGSAPRSGFRSSARDTRSRTLAVPMRPRIRPLALIAQRGGPVRDSRARSRRSERLATSRADLLGAGLSGILCSLLKLTPPGRRDWPDAILAAFGRPPVAAPGGNRAAASRARSASSLILAVGLACWALALETDTSGGPASSPVNCLEITGESLIVPQVLLGADLALPAPLASL
jgi:hypothetical protein